MASFYGVKVGRKPGVYTTWGQCEKQVRGFKGAIYKKFNSESEAMDFISSTTNPNLQMGIKGSKPLKQREDLKEGEIIAYVDGSYDNSKKKYSYGIVLLSRDSEITLHGWDNHPDLVGSRNVAGELLGTVIAIYKAIELGYKKIYVHYDYEGIEKWITGEWKASSVAATTYRDRINITKGHVQIEFIKVAAHTGVIYNEKADELAKLALKSS